MDLEKLTEWLLACAKMLKSTPIKDIDGPFVTLYAGCLELAGVQTEHIGPVFTRIIKRATFFPTPAEFITKWEAMYPSKPYWVIPAPEKQEAPALPLTPEVRAECHQRLNEKFNKTVKQLSRKPKLKAVDFLADDPKIKPLPEPTDSDRARLDRQVQDAKKALSSKTSP